MQVKRVHPIIYALISSNLATYKELRDDYNIEEVLALYEIHRVSSYNRNLLLEEKTKHGKQVGIHKKIKS